MAKLLSIDRVVRVSVNLQPLAARRRNFGVLLLVGSSDVIDPVERIRQYTGIDGVAQDFGLDAPEYKAAELFFSQTPRPSIVQIGRWVKAPSPAILRGAVVDGLGATATGWTPITNGAFAVGIKGQDTSITGLDFSGVTNLNGVASIISTALAAHGASCRFDGERFILATTSAGAEATLGYATAVVGGDEGATDISTMLRWTVNTALPIIDGSGGESAKECVTHLADVGDWYGCVFTEALTVEQHLDVAGYIEASAKSRIYGITNTDTRTLDKVFTDDVASRLKALKRKRTMVAFSRNPYAVTRGPKLNLLRIEEQLSAAHLRLSRVYVECLPYADIIDRYDSAETFFYLDPPYWNCETYYGKGIFSREDFSKLAAQLASIKGKFLLSLNDTQGVREVFKAFDIESVQTKYTCSNGKNVAAGEVLITK